MAAIMGETYPELYGAIGIHSGLAYGSANDVLSAFTAMRGQEGIAQAQSRNGFGGPKRGAADDRVPWQRRHHGPPFECRADHCQPWWNRIKASRTEHGPSGETRLSRLVAERDDGTHGIECWMIEGAQHAWSGGHPGGSYADPLGPNASAAMVGFFLQGASDVIVE